MGGIVGRDEFARMTSEMSLTEVIAILNLASSNKCTVFAENFGTSPGVMDLCFETKVS